MLLKCFLPLYMSGPHDIALVLFQCSMRNSGTKLVQSIAEKQPIANLCQRDYFSNVLNT